MGGGIVITDTESSISHIHDRMPLVLEEGNIDVWMRGSSDQAAALMKPCAGRVDTWEATTAAGKVESNRPDPMSRLGAGSLA